MTKMVKPFSFSTFLTFVILLIASNGYGRVYSDSKQEKLESFVIKGHISIQFEDNVVVSNLQKGFGKVNFALPTLDRILEKFQAFDANKIFPWRKQKLQTNSDMIDLSRFFEIKIPDSIDVWKVVAELSQNPNIKMAEPVWAIPVSASPNDPLWPSQWAMEPPAPDPDFYDAWDYETGSDSIIFALIDSGIKYKHNDLIGNIWVNPGEDLDGDGVVYDEDDLDGVDNDGNGIVDDIIGYDFFSGFGGLTIWPGEDGGIPDSDPDDFNGHGTHVAGIAAAANNNGVDVTGAAGGWFGGHRSYRGCRIICLRIGGSAVHPTYGYEAGYINSNNAAQAIDYAVANGANVINSSWGGSSTSAAAANNAIIAGVTFCHAGGNDNSNSPDNLDNVSGMISVASVGPYSDVKSSFSNYGQWIDVSAPGSSILSTYSYHYSPTTATLDGTSMASPMVAGLALLIRSAMPSLSKNQVDSIIFNSADSTSLYIANPFMQGMLGSGRIDAYQALINLPNAKFTSDVTQGQAPLTVQFTDLSPNSPVAWDWSFGTGDVASTQNPQYTYNNPGIYSVSFKENENHPLGWGEEHLRNYIWVTADTMIMDSVEGEKNSQVVVPIYLSHTEQIKQIQFAFSYQNNLGVSFDSFSVAGLRTEYFESVEFNAVDFFNKRASILMKTNVAEGSTYLKPDTGNILNLYFNISGSASEGVMTLDTVNVSGKEPKITTLWGDYWPVFTPGKIAVISGSCCIGIRGNIDGSPENPPDDPGIDIADLVYFVDFSFAQPPGPAPVCNDGTEQNPYYSEADVDGDGEVNIGDIVYMVEFMFTQPPGPEPVGCP